MNSLVNNHHINKEKWNTFIRESQSPLVYAESWSLDIVTPGWKAIINDNYQIPLPLNKKLGIPYSLQPFFFTQQLGTFLKKETTLAQVDFFNDLKKSVFHLNINVNKHTPLPTKTLTIKQNNQTLLLDKSYEELKQQYTSSHKKNIRRSKRNNIIIQEIPIETAVGFFQKGYSKILKNLDKDLFNTYQLLYFAAKENANAICYGAFSGDKLVAVIGLIYNNRHIHTLYLASDKGKELKSLFCLIDFVLEKFAGTKLIFDFGGSNIDSIAYFNKGFGAKNENYHTIIWNKFLPNKLAHTLSK